jgi:nitrous oxidase accessory protein NosD
MHPAGTALFSSLLIVAATGTCADQWRSADVDTVPKGTCGDGAKFCQLKESPPVIATYDGQIIEGLRIEATNEPGILVHNFSDVMIRNVEILHDGAHGISCHRSPGLVIENVSIVHSGARTSSIHENNIDCYRAEGLRIRNVRLTEGAAGIYVLESPHVHLSHIEGHNFRGPNPRGQLVQFNLSPDALLEDFSVRNVVGVGRPEDVVSIYQSSGTVIRRGLIDGNDSTNGVGVNIEFSDDCLVEDVDTIHQSNGSFGAHYASNITFRRTRAKDNICADQGRGRPASGGIIWSGYNNVSGLRIEDSQHWNRCNPAAIVHDLDRFDVVELKELDFTPRAPIALRFPWERRDSHPPA